MVNDMISKGEVIFHNNALIETTSQLSTTDVSLAQVDRHSPRQDTEPIKSPTLFTKPKKVTKLSSILNQAHSTPRQRRDVE